MDFSSLPPVGPARAGHRPQRRVLLLRLPPHPGRLSEAAHRLQARQEDGEDGGARSWPTAWPPPRSSSSCPSTTPRSGSPAWQLKVDPRMCMGDANAPVTMAEFSDFECPYCAKARPVLEEFAKKNAAKVRFCYLPYPLPMHANAIPAGRRCCGRATRASSGRCTTRSSRTRRTCRPAALPGWPTRWACRAPSCRRCSRRDTYKEELDGFKAPGQRGRHHRHARPSSSTAARFELGLPSRTCSPTASRTSSSGARTTTRGPPTDAQAMTPPRFRIDGSSQLVPEERHESASRWRAARARTR